MNLRTKKTLTALLSGAILHIFSIINILSRGAHLTPVFFVFVALNLAIAGYTWWWYGDSPKAVGLRAKAEAKKAARQQLS
ncbi:hypothetical protein F7Q99_27740 [Streptomyces kaniharaensis]|uniref:Uncharacterized protein n=1 Tax=Streptomyces kaniharaensis TaxID=212423 RepID=A0A6N7KYQ7_9ACTN|nr:hypothetical protein [Streptomyces kaniharaensis]MQS15945.1 hypothetical protein [Streptomyces kaniharaensis]